MHSVVGFLCCVLACLSLVSATIDCPIYGPVFPEPTNLRKSKTLESAFSSLKSTLDDAVENSSDSLDNSTAYSLIFFSADDDESLFEWHHAPKAVKQSKFGVNDIDANSIYRIGSVSKLITAYTFLAKLGDGYWDRSLMEFLPELISRDGDGQDSIKATSWAEVKVGHLASHTAGILCDLISLQDLSVVYSNPTNYGLPPLAPSDMPRCVSNSSNPCGRDESLAAFQQRGPIYKPGTTPIYSNAGYQLLAYVLESIAGQSFEDVFIQSIKEPLGLDNTSYTEPEDGPKRGVIVTDPWASWWNFDLGDVGPSGAFYSTPADFAVIGRSILRSSLLESGITRSWMKPVAHTSVNASVGRPWEIARQSLTGTNLYPQPKIAERTVDVFTKGGDVGDYHSQLALIPDYNVGFGVMVAGVGASQIPLATIARDVIVPVLEAVARESAHDAYTGVYETPDMDELNSTLHLTTERGKPGLGIQTWISNGTNMEETLGAVREMRLYPTNLEESDGDISKRAFRTMRWPGPLGVSLQDTLYGCPSWLLMDRAIYGSQPIDEMVFELDDKGMAVGVYLTGLRVRLRKVNK